MRSARVVSSVISTTLGFVCAWGIAKTTDATTKTDAVMRKRMEQKGRAAEADPPMVILNSEF